MTLAADAERSFHMASQLRSSEYHQVRIHALYRLSLHCDDPPRSKIRSALKKVLDFRKCPRPGAPRPLCIPMLAHSTFQKSVQTFISHLIQTNADSLVPFHLPFKKIVVGKRKKIAELLYNHQVHLQQWQVHTAPQCPCNRLLQEHPNLLAVEGHIESPASMLSVSRRLQTLLQHSAMTSVYPNFEQHIEDTWQIVQKWSLKNGIHTLQFQQWRDFVSQQWKQHQNVAWTTIKYRDIAFVRAVIGPLVVHGRDHAPSHCHVYCLWRFWKTVRDTFEDPEVYQSCPLERTLLIQFLGSITRRPWLRPYKWGVRKDAKTLPFLQRMYLLSKTSSSKLLDLSSITKGSSLPSCFEPQLSFWTYYKKNAYHSLMVLKLFPKWYRA